MKLKLKEIEVTKIDGSKQKLKLDYKGLANYIFNQTKDLGELELARELYKKGEIEVDKEKAFYPDKRGVVDRGNIYYEIIYQMVDGVIIDEYYVMWNGDRNGNLILY